MALSDDKLWDLWNAQGTDNMSKEEAFVFARAIEAEARRDALEEAATVALEFRRGAGDPVCGEVANAIRALKESPPPTA